MTDDWIKSGFERKKQQQADEQRKRDPDEAHRKTYESKVDGLWDELVARLQRAVEQYNTHVSNKEERIESHRDPGTRAFHAQKTIYPAGYVDCALQREHGYIATSYTFTASPDSLPEKRQNQYQIKAQDDGLVVTDARGQQRNAKGLADEFAEMVLEPFFAKL